MSKKLNMEFVADPVTFVSKMPVVASGAIADDKHVKEYQKKGVKEKEFKGVPGNLRIIAGNLDDKGAYAQLTLEYANVGPKLAEGWMAMYYLPWIPDSHVRTTLRPRSKTTRDGQAKDKEIKLFGNANEYQNADDPDIFFTAAVDGCMVSAMGPVDEPVVLHSNATRPPNSTKMGMEDDERVVKMTKELGSFIGQKPINPRNSKSDFQKPLSATPQMYMGKDRHDALLGKGYTKISPEQIQKDEKLMGTIFGKRTGGKWAFYYERLIQYQVAGFEEEWREDDDDPNKKTLMLFPSNPQKRYRLDGPVQEFWPTGPGHVLFKD